MKVKCKCGYVWESKTKMMIVSCPYCGSKVRIKERGIKSKNPKEAVSETSKGGSSKDENRQ